MAQKRGGSSSDLYGDTRQKLGEEGKPTNPEKTGQIKKKPPKRKEKKKG